MIVRSQISDLVIVLLQSAPDAGIEVLHVGQIYARKIRIIDALLKIDDRIGTASFFLDVNGCAHEKGAVSRRKI